MDMPSSNENLATVAGMWQFLTNGCNYCYQTNQGYSNHSTHNHDYSFIQLQNTKENWGFTNHQAICFHTSIVAVWRHLYWNKRIAFLCSITAYHVAGKTKSLFMYTEHCDATIEKQSVGTSASALATTNNTYFCQEVIFLLKSCKEPLQLASDPLLSFTSDPSPPLLTVLPNRATFLS